MKSLVKTRIGTYFNCIAMTTSVISERCCALELFILIPVPQIKIAEVCLYSKHKHFNLRNSVVGIE